MRYARCACCRVVVAAVDAGRACPVCEGPRPPTSSRIPRMEGWSGAMGPAWERAPGERSLRAALLPILVLAGAMAAAWTLDPSRVGSPDAEVRELARVRAELARWAPGQGPVPTVPMTAEAGATAHRLAALHAVALELSALERTPPEEHAERLARARARLEDDDAAR